MRDQHRRDHLAAPAPVEHDLDPRLADDLEVTDPPDGGAGALERAEPTLARPGERGGLVVPDPPGPGLGQRAPDPVGVGLRDVHGQLVQRVPLGAQRPDVRQAEGRGQRVRHPGIGPVGVGVRGEQRAPGPGQRRQRAPLRRRLGEPVHPAQEQRVVHDQQVGPPRGRLPGHLDGGVDREQHLPDRLRRVAVHEAHRVPLVGRVGRVPPVQQVDDVAQGGHGARLANTDSSAVMTCLLERAGLSRAVCVPVAVRRRFMAGG